MRSVGGGLRERHRQRVLIDLHEAALSLTDEVGFGGATIELIASRAGVSRRTFFNYYASKEDAVLGAVPPSVPEQALSAFIENLEVDQFTRTVRLLVAIIRSTYVAGTTTMQERRRLVDRYPQVRTRMAQHVSAAESLTEAALSERIARPPSPDHAAVSARALLMLAGTVLRFAHGNDPHALESADSAAIEDAISVFGDAVRDIS